MSLSSLLFTTVRVLGSAIAGPHSAVLVSGKGLGGDDDTDDAVNGETMTDDAAFGAPGIVWRPRPPSSHDGEEIAAESRVIRTPSGPEVVAWRDLRWHRNYPAPKEGSMAFVGYGGGFLAFEDTENGLSSFTLYVPYNKNSQGVPQKAMSVSIDPEQESLMLIHGDGYAVTMDPDNGIVHRSDNGTSFTQLKGGAFSVVADTISLQGNVAMGANTAAAIPLLPGVSSQPTTSVFFSPI